MSESARVRVRVSPGAVRSEVVGRHGDGWKLRVAAPPEAGRANAEVVRLLAAALGVPVAGVAVVAGRSSRDKWVEIDGVPPSVVERRLAAAARPVPGRTR